MTTFKYDNADVWDDQLTEALSLEKDGLTLRGLPLLQAQLMERKFDSSLQVYGQPFSRAGWRQVVATLRRQERKCSVPALQERMKAARIMASKMPATSSPWDALKCMWQLEAHGGIECCDGVARRLMREACYKVLNKEFVGRDVG